MRIAYLGTPQVAVGTLKALVADGHDVVVVISQPDRRRGRGSQVQSSPVKQAAMQFGIPTSDSVEDLLHYNVELGVVVAYGRLIKPHILEQVPMVNLHFSLLPKWRGAAPVERAILAGDQISGVCLMALEEGLDTGPIFDSVSVPIDPEESVEELRSRLAEHGTQLLLKSLREGFPQAVAQQGQPTNAAKVEREEHHIDWNAPTDEIHRRIRLGRAWTTFRGRRVIVVKALRVPGDSESAPRPLVPGEIDSVNAFVGTGDAKALELVALQPEGKSIQPVRSWLNGVRLGEGERFTGQ